MIDLKQIFLNDKQLGKNEEGLLKRGVKIEKLLKTKEKLKKKLELTRQINDLRNKRNSLSQIDCSKEEKELVKEIKKKIVNYGEEIKKITKELNVLLFQLPNIPKLDTPEDQIGNKVIKEIYFFNSNSHNFCHQEIIQKLNLVDKEKGTILSGNKFVVYQKKGSELLHALILFLLQENKKQGYQLFDVPYIINKKNFFNTGQLPKFEGDLYLLKNSDLGLIPTAEVPLVNLYQQQLLEEKDLPIKLSSYSPCFRAESGAAGQKSQGLIRLHQFHKVEIVQIVHPIFSDQILKKMVKTVSGILKKLKISHRIVDLCYKELGVAAAKTLDIEVWLPNTKKWLEISSCSNCTDFQTRRANIRILEKNGKKVLAHSLNASSLAIDRLILTLCEYYFEEESEQLVLPKCLQKYLKLFED